MATVLFCTKDDVVRQSSILDGNIDADKLIPSLFHAQTHYLKPILGTDLYDKFSSEITAGTLADPYLALLKTYVKPILIHACLAEFLKSCLFTVSSKGVFKHTSENAETATTEEVKDLVQVERDRAESYTERFLDYMLYNGSTFSEWTSNTGADLKPNKESFNIDWVL